MPDETTREMPTRPATCECGARFDQPYAELLGVTVTPQRSCDACTAERRERAEADLRDRRLWRFEKECPGEFLDSDEARFPKAVWDAVRTWSYSPRGIGLVGDPGTGKTRMLWALGRRLAEEEGIVPKGLTHGELEYLAQHQFEGDNTAQFRGLKSCRLLILDDFAKGSLHGATLRKLFELVDHRTSHQKPILWTSNLKGSKLKEQFTSPDWTNHGLPLCGRLVDYCEKIEL